MSHYIHRDERNTLSDERRHEAQRIAGAANERAEQRERFGEGYSPPELDALKERMFLLVRLEDSIEQLFVPDLSRLLNRYRDVFKDDPVCADMFGVLISALKEQKARLNAEWWRLAGEKNKQEKVA